MKRNRIPRALWPLIALAAIACGGEPTTSPTEPPPSLAKGGRSGGGGKNSLSVNAADPDTVTIDTTLTIRILGSGFGPDATVEYALAGVTTTKVTATSVVFVSSSELRTTTTIAADAPLASYDIAVTSGGKRGIGVEKLLVVAQSVYLPELGGVRSTALDVNDDGIIVGWMADAGDTGYAMRWSPLGSSWTAEVIGSGAAVAINAGGEILRRVYDGTVFHSWIRLPGGAEVYLGPGSYGNGLADDGTVVGTFIDATGVHQYGVWQRSGPSTWGPFVSVPALAGYTNSDLNDISKDGGWIAGSVFEADSLPWATVWRREANGWTGPVFVDVGALGGAHQVNSSGVIAGAIWPCIDGTNPACIAQAAYWPAPGTPSSLLIADGCARVTDISEAGWVVGYACVQRRGKGVASPVLWYSGTSTPTNLGTPKPSQRGEVRAINDRGLAVGEVRDASLMPHHAVAWILP